MNTLSVMLSAGCLIVALTDLRMRSDYYARRRAAILSTAAWLSMAFVASDQHRRCELMQQHTTVTVPAKQIVAEALRGQWKYEAPDGGVVTFQEPAKAQAQLVGADGWHAKQNDRL